jgi:hypothetical protein
MQARCNRGKPDAAPVAGGATIESDLHADIIELCKSKGWIYFHGSMAHRAMRTLGEPDFTILADGGRVFFVEAKTKTGKLSVEQAGLQMWAERLGHTIYVVRSLPEFLSMVSVDPKPKSP